MPLSNPHSDEDAEDTEPINPPPPLSLGDTRDPLQVTTRLETQATASRTEKVQATAFNQDSAQESISSPSADSLRALPYAKLVRPPVTGPTPMPLDFQYSINLFIQRAIQETDLDLTTSRARLFMTIDSLKPKIQSIFQDKDAYDDQYLLYYFVKNLITSLTVK